MDNYCAFSKDHKCLKWEDYQLTRHELEEADVLCHGNWIEIQRLRDYIDKLIEILDKNKLDYPKF
jgi:hypothetical protein